MNEALAFEPYTFEEGIKVKLEERYPESNIVFHDVEKNNGVMLRAITIVNPGSNISPTIYLNDFKKQYEETHDIDEICNKIAELNEKHEGVEFDVDSVVNFSKVKTRICAKLISRERNRNLLKTVPYRDFLDLAVVYFVSLEEMEFASILIHDNLLEKWGVTEEELYSCAMENMPKLFPESFLTMTQVLRGMIADEFVDDENLAEIDDVIYVATNKKKVFGAAVMLYPNFLEHVRETIGSNFYIIPSSIHEILIIPETKAGLDKEELLETVQTVNDTQVSNEEILADNVYYYNSESKKIETLF